MQAGMLHSDHDGRHNRSCQRTRGNCAHRDPHPLPNSHPHEGPRTGLLDHQRIGDGLSGFQS